MEKAKRERGGGGGGQKNRGGVGGADGAEVMRKIRVRSRVDDRDRRAERRERREALPGERTAVSLAGVSAALEGTKKAHQMETITLTGGNNTVPVLYSLNAVVVIRGKTKVTGPAAGAQMNQ